MISSKQRTAERALRREILDRVRELACMREEEPFVPGVTPVKYAGRVYDDEEMVALVDSALEFWLTAGRWHNRLERDLAKWYGVPHARLVNSGSSANLVATAALMSPMLEDQRLVPGDEVITVAAGFPTTVAPALQLGLIPVFIDVSLPTANASVDLLAEALSPRTRAVILAHTLGNPFDLQAVTDFCREHDLWLIEDNCDAAGSLYRGRKTGSFGDLATLSFYPPHHMTTGEGGAVLCSNDLFERIVSSLRDWGRDCWCNPGVDNTCGKRFGWQQGSLPHGYDHKYIYSHLGFNVKMTDMQASIGSKQLEKLDAFCEKRRDNWTFFRDAFDDLQDCFILPEPTNGSEPSWFGFLLTVRDDAPFTRDEIVRHCESAKIQTRMLFAGNLVRQPALACSPGAGSSYRIASELTTTDRVMDHSFWVGVYPGLQLKGRAYVVERIREFVAERSNW